MADEGRGLTPPPPPHNPSDPGCVEHDPDGLYRREIKCKVCYRPPVSTEPPTTQVAGRVSSCDHGASYGNGDGTRTCILTGCGATFPAYEWDKPRGLTPQERADIDAADGDD